MTCILAIDPGISGAIVFYTPEKRDLAGEKRDLAVYDMPIMNGDVDPHMMRRMIEIHRPDQAIIERVSPMPKEGVSSVWRFSAAFTTACVVVKLSKIPLVLVPPAMWKRIMNLKGGKEGKDEARERASEMFPGMALHFTRKKDHGRAEAALLALYAHTKLRRDIHDDRVQTPFAEQS